MSDATREQTGVWRALAQRNYRLFVTGQLVSLIGTWTQSVAESWLVYRLTGSATWLGVSAFCQQVPTFFFATFGGLVADRHAKRNVLLATQAGSMLLAFALAALTLTNLVRVSQLLVMATLLGIIRAFDSPARQSFVVDMVGRENLTTAIGLNSSMVMGATMVGPALAGFAIHAFGEGWCFLVNGVSFIAVIIGLLMMRDLPPPAVAKSREPMLFRIVEGFRFVAAHDRVRALFLLLAVTALMGTPSATLMPVFASKVLHGDARTLGWLMGAQGTGAFLAGLVLTTRKNHEGTYRWIAAACATLGIALVVFALSRALWLSLFVSLFLGATTLGQVVATNTLVQVLTPDALRGRVMAIWVMILMGFAPIGSLAAGAIATAFDPRWPLAVGGVACVAGALVFTKWLRGARISAPAGDL